MKFAAPRGTQDLLPDVLVQWHYVEETARQLLHRAHYREIRPPIFEDTALFERGVGEGTDIVHKEMYTFEKGDRRLTLRPEGTAGVVRAYVENGLSRSPKPVKLYYIGSMFRYERPQAGRQRQFHQLGLEIFGLDTPQADAEAILMALTLFQTLGIQGLELRINNVGCPDCRESMKAGLRELIKPNLAEYCEDCHVRFEKNILRMLDCKVEACQTLLSTPTIQAFLEQDSTCEACQVAFSKLIELLTAMDVSYKVDRRMVRGLDYYTRTVFEILATGLGAQNTVCGGGRYNQLVEDLGGPPTPAIGWALGMERLISLLPPVEAPILDYFIVTDQVGAGFQLAKTLREEGFQVEMDLSGKGFGKQLETAHKLGARYAILLGSQELEQGLMTLKNLATGEQFQEALRLK